MLHHLSSKSRLKATEKLITLAGKGWQFNSSHWMNAQNIKALAALQKIMKNNRPKVQLHAARYLAKQRDLGNQYIKQLEYEGIKALCQLGDENDVSTVLNAVITKRNIAKEIYPGLLTLITRSIPAVKTKTLSFIVTMDNELQQQYNVGTATHTVDFSSEELKTLAVNELKRRNES